MKPLRICASTWLMLGMLLYPSYSSGETNTNDGKTAVNAQYILSRTAYKDKYQPITIISSKNDLIRLLDNNILNKIEKYPDGYFTDSSLVIVWCPEPSGLIRHSVESIDENGDIVINRKVPPGELTCDMAYWHILIKVNNKIKAKQYRTVFIEVRE